MTVESHLSALSASKTPAGAAKFFPVEVVNVRKDTDDLTVITFKPQAADRDRFSFVPGQFVLCRAKIDGEDVRRAYSICTPSGTDTLQLGIKHISDGVFSNWVNETLKVGDTLDISQPDGRFFGTSIDLKQGEYIGIAAGSGITPVLSIIETALLSGGDSRFTLYYGNRTAASVAFRQRLHGLKNRFMDRLRIVHVLSREEGEVDLTHGRIDGERLSKLLTVFNPQPIDRAFICGPNAMMFGARDVLSARGMDTDDIRIESYGDHEPRTAPQDVDDTRQSEIRMTVAGRTRTFKMSYHETLLDAGRAAEVELPFACKAGVCATCRCKLIKGEVDTDKNYALTAEELEAGWILSCQATPASETVEVSFDV